MAQAFFVSIHTDASLWLVWYVTKLERNFEVYLKLQVKVPVQTFLLCVDRVASRLALT